MLRTITFFAALLMATPLVAQTQPEVLQPETAVVGPGGVDLNTGQYRSEGVDLSVGSDANGGITFNRVDQGNKSFKSNWHFFLSKNARSAPPTPPLYNHSVEAITWELENKAIAKTWLRYLNGPMSEQGIPSPGYTKLEYVGSAWRFTMADGTVINFQPSSSADGNVWATSMTRKDGVVYTFAYDSGNRLSRVWSNTGYELILEYATTGNDRITKACVYSTTTVTPPSNTIQPYVCPMGAGVQTAFYGYTLVDGRYILSSVKDVMNKDWITDVQSGSRAYYKPGISSPWLTNTLGGAPDGGFSESAKVVLSQQLADGRNITYAYADLLIYQSDMFSQGYKPKSGRGTGWTINGAQTTQVGWAYAQGNMNGQPGSLYISPAPNLMVDPLGRVSGATYEGGNFPYGNATSKTLIGGRQEVYTYSVTSSGGTNLASRTWKVRSGTTGPDLTTSYTYNCTVTFNCAKPATIIDPKGNVTDYTYDQYNGLLLTETMPADVNGVRPQKRYTWLQQTPQYKNSSGALVSGAPVYVIYMISECRTTASCLGTGDETKTTFAYPVGTANNLLPISKTVQAGDGSLIATTSFTYDSDGNKVTEDGPLTGTADTSRWQYDAKRRVVYSMTPDPDGAGPNGPLAAHNIYDDAGRLIKAEKWSLPSGATTWGTFTPIDSVETDYDALDRKIQERRKDNLGATQALTQYSYDSSGRLDCTAARMNPAVYGSLPASACSLGAQGTDGPDRITRNTYDAGDQLLTVTEAYGTPDQSIEATYSYNDSGKKDTLTDARGFKAQMGYDGHDRQISWNFPDMVSPGLVSTTDYEAYTYDNNGNRLTQRKRDGSVLSFAYDNLNRMVTKVVPGSTPSTRDVYLAYDLQGHQTGARFDSQSGADALTSGYDALGRLTSTTLAMDGVSRPLTYGYDIRGFRTSVTHPDSNTFTYTPDTLGRLTSIGENASGSLAGFAYDPQGRLSSLSRANATYTSYGYDSISRLSGLTHDLTATASDLGTSFTYNPANQTRTEVRSNDSYAWTGAVPVTRTYTTNGLNQYSAAGPATFLYDANGNLTSDGTNSYLYDVENRLVSATIGSQAVTLRYDPMGRLYEVTGATTTRFLYDGDELVAEYDTAGTMLKRYVHGLGVDDPVIMYDGSGLGVRKYLHADRQGSIIALSDGAGNAAVKNTYDEYGIPAATNSGRFAYTGQIWLPEIGMYHYKARLYSPTLGRFMQTDPIGYKDQINLYAYVGDDPVNKADPSGMFFEPIILETSLPDGNVHVTRTDEGKPTGQLVLMKQPFADNKPATLTPGYRTKILDQSQKSGLKVAFVSRGSNTERENTRAEGKTNSEHLESNGGNAADYTIDGQSGSQTAKTAVDSGEFGRVALYKGGTVHVDDKATGQGYFEADKNNEWIRKPKGPQDVDPK